MPPGLRGSDNSDLGTALRSGRSVRPVRRETFSLANRESMERHKIIRIDDEFMHAEAVKPALALLTDPRNKGPREEIPTRARAIPKGEARRS